MAGAFLPRARQGPCGLQAEILPKAAPTIGPMRVAPQEAPEHFAICIFWAVQVVRGWSLLRLQLRV